VTEGIIWGIGRAVSESPGDGSPGATLPDAIQTSAAINPGNSGGALVDLAGDVIGIPTLAAIEPEIGLGGSLAPGIGFAISSNLVTDIAGQITSSDHVTNSHRAELGVEVVEVVDQNGQPVGAGIEAPHCGRASRGSRPAGRRGDHRGE
jgi:S1-C subfamily serine protease